MKTADNVSKIIRKFIESNWKSSHYEDSTVRLVVSLFALRSEIQYPANVYRDEILSTLRDYLVNLEEYISSEEINVLLEHYVEVVDYCFNFYCQDIHPSWVKYAQPKELTDFCASIVDFKEGDRIYNPFAGIGSYAIAYPKCEFHGEELNHAAWALMQINLEAHNSNANIKQGDSFVSLANDRDDILYDGVVMTPPFGLHDKKNNIDEFSAVEYAFKKLKNGGQLLAVLPISFCALLGPNLSLRKYLIGNRFLRGVITLPRIFLPTTGISVCVIVAEKKVHDSFFVVDGSDFAGKERTKYNYSYDTLLSAIREGLSKYVKELKFDIFDLEGNMNLTPSRYLYELPKMENPTSLNELVDFYEDARRVKGEKIWKAEKFSEDWLNCKLTLTPYARATKTFVNDGRCLMATITNSNIKVGKVGTSHIGDKIADMRFGTFAFRIKDEGRITADYLLYCLKSPVVSEQVKALSPADVPTILTINDFGNITIPLLSLSEQRKIIKSAKQKYLAQLGFTRTASDIAHMLGGPMQKITNIIDILSDSEDLSCENETLVSSLKVNFNYMKRLLQSDCDFDKMPLTPIRLEEFVEDYIYEYRQFGANTFKARVSSDLNYEAKVMANRDALYIMFDCLFDNANRHGFHKKYNKDNLLEIDLSRTQKDDRRFIEMIVRDNGDPIPEGFSLADYVSKGRFDAKSGRSGLGGYHVNSIVQAMGGEITDMSSVIMENYKETSFTFIIPMVEE